jgi:hypothetical protein
MFGCVAQGVLQSVQSARKGRIESVSSLDCFIDRSASEDRMYLGGSTIGVIGNELLLQKTRGGWCAAGAFQIGHVRRTWSGSACRSRTRQGGFDAGQTVGDAIYLLLTTVQDRLSKACTAIHVSSSKVGSWTHYSLVMITLVVDDRSFCPLVRHTLSLLLQFEHGAPLSQRTFLCLHASHWVYTSASAGFATMPLLTKLDGLTATARCAPV